EHPERGVRGSAVAGGRGRGDAGVFVRSRRRGLSPHFLHHRAGAYSRGGGAGRASAHLVRRRCVVRRPSGSLLISVVLHIVLGAGLIWVLSIPYSFHDWMGLTPAPK